MREVDVQTFTLQAMFHFSMKKSTMCAHNKKMYTYQLRNKYCKGVGSIVGPKVFTKQSHGFMFLKYTHLHC